MGQSGVSAAEKAALFGDTAWGAMGTLTAEFAIQRDGAKADAAYWKRQTETLADQCAHNDRRMSELQAELRATNAKLNDALELAGLLDYIETNGDTTLVICQWKGRPDGSARYVPLTSTDEAMSIMLAEQAEDEPDIQPGDCHCGGVPSCNICQGRG